MQIVNNFYDSNRKFIDINENNNKRLFDFDFVCKKVEGMFLILTMLDMDMMKRQPTLRLKQGMES